MFALIGLAIALALIASGPKPVHVVVLSVVAVLLAGPCVLRFGVGRAVPRLQLLRALHLGVPPAPARRDADVRRRRRGVARARSRESASARGDIGWRGIGALVAMFALLPVTDETSAGVLGLCLGDRLAVRSASCSRPAAGGGAAAGRAGRRSSPPTCCSPPPLAPGGPLNRSVDRRATVPRRAAAAAAALDGRRAGGAGRGHAARLGPS